MAYLPIVDVRSWTMAASSITNTTTITTGPLMYQSTGSLTYYTSATGTAQHIFRSVEDKIAYQQEAYVEPRDHAYYPAADNCDDPAVCLDCKPHNVHRYSPDKHLYVIDEDIDWQHQLAS